VKPKTCLGCGKVTADREELETKWIQVFVEFQNSTYGSQHQDADLSCSIACACTALMKIAERTKERALS